ncbi:alpha/beta hydrolase [Halomonas sp. 328]|uniref:alpha/beta hydrolase n=1 Tax=Halomonas sp. 328 TaxID=2776704 RepID=UPI0018A7849D|nr:alpha/beta hydrolase [Halomonas sp. 328]MBF8221998.1 alpha/beta hydrolase [Halomonas sp. 328]
MNDCIELRGEWPTSPDEEGRRQAYRQGLMALQAEMGRRGATPFHLEALTVGAPEGALDPQGRHYERIFRHLFGGVRPTFTRATADTLVLTATLAAIRPGEASPVPVWHGLTPAQVGRAYSPRATVPEAPEIFEAWRRRGDACLAGEGVVRDLAYGPGERQRLDLLLADAPGAPLHVFLHGGYWQAMDKDDHAHLFAPLRERGVNVALIEYTLAPQATLGDQVEEVRQALTFLWRQAATYGYDRHRLQLSGHSAGGHLGAWLLATDWPAREAGMPAQPFGSALLVSGLYELEPLRHLPFGPLVGLTSVERARDGSPIHARPHPGARLCLAVGEQESEEFHWQSRALAEAWGGEVEVLSIAGTHHFSVMETFQEGELMARALRYLG